MAIASTTQTANAIQSFYEKGWYEGVYRNDELLSLLRAFGMDEQMASGGTGFSWHINSNYNTSVEIFTEGQAAPKAVAQSWARATVSWVYFWGWIQVTGHARDALQNGIFDAIEAEMMLAQRDVKDLRTTTFLGTSNNGLQQAVDSTTAYAGITRGSAAYFESTESSTATIAGLRAMHLSQRDADKRGNPTFHMVSPTVGDWYAARAGLPGTGNHILQGNGPSNVDVGYAWNGQTFMGRPIIEVPDLTSSVWLSLDMSAGNMVHRIIRNMRTEFHHNEGDTQVFKITTGSTIAKKMPKWDAKLTGIS